MANKILIALIVAWTVALNLIAFAESTGLGMGTSAFCIMVYAMYLHG